MDVVLVGLACIFPLALYCLVLSFFQRRRHPVVVPGPWDAAGLLLAASGFLLVAIPYTLYRLHDRYGVYYELFGEMPIPLKNVADLVCALYVAVVLVGATYLVRRRRHVLSIYNVEPAGLEDSLTAVLDQLGVTWARVGNQVFVRPGASPPGGNGVPLSVRAEAPAVPVSAVQANAAHPAPAAAPLPSLDPTGPGRPLLELDPFPAMRHAYVSWKGEPGSFREDVQVRLLAALSKAYTPPHPVGLWLGTIASCLFAGLFFTLVFAIVTEILGMRHR
jgi:hypothetical protein